MKVQDLAQFINDIDDRLIMEAEQPPRSKSIRQRGKARRWLSAVAVLLLMLGSFTGGAFAYGDEMEMITLPGNSMSLVLPEDWEGKYGYEVQGNDLFVYLHSVREDEEWSSAGHLFSIQCVEGTYPLDYQMSAAPQKVIASCGGMTYFFTWPSDVQYNPHNEAVAQEYIAMSQQIKDIRILLSDWMQENSINDANWQEGTVYVNLLSQNKVTDTIICNSEASALLREVVLSKERTQELGSFTSDMELLLDGESWFLNSSSGQIMHAFEYPYGAVLTAEELQLVRELILGQ